VKRTFQLGEFTAFSRDTEIAVATEHARSVRRRTANGVAALEPEIETEAPRPKRRNFAPLWPISLSGEITATFLSDNPIT
jgi:hypothetical protein